MMQGNGNSSNSGRKREPIVTSISPGGASEIGISQFQNPTPLTDGRGFTAPQPVGVTNHESGSQGRHK